MEVDTVQNQSYSVVVDFFPRDSEKDDGIRLPTLGLAWEPLKTSKYYFSYPLVKTFSRKDKEGTIFRLILDVKICQTHG